jgi:ankyrin repeat protein
VSQLITARCNVDLAMANGSTPLLVAAREGHTAIVSQLITARCNVDIAKTDGTTPLFITGKQGHVTVVVHLIEARCNVNLARTDGVTPFLMATAKGHRSVVKKLIDTRCDVNLRCGYDSQNTSLDFSIVSPSPCPPNLCPCLCTVHPIKYHSVSFLDVFIGEFCTLCPTLRHVHSKYRATDPDFIYDNELTKPSPSSALDYFIEDNSCHYQQWRSDFDTNQTFKTDFRKNNPAFKKENPDLR